MAVFFFSSRCGLSWSQIKYLSISSKVRSKILTRLAKRSLVRFSSTNPFNLWTFCSFPVSASSKDSNKTIFATKFGSNGDVRFFCNLNVDVLQKLFYFAACLALSQIIVVTFYMSVKEYLESRNTDLTKFIQNSMASVLRR